MLRNTVIKSPQGSAVHLGKKVVFVQTRISPVLAALLVCIFALPAVAQTAKPSGITFGIRQYTSHSDDEESPFGEGDLSYLAAYEYHEVKAYWQLGVSFTPHATSTSMVANVESVTTPQMRLIFEEGMFMFGVGVLKHYVKQEDANHWSAMYWELEAGLRTPVSSSLELRAVAYYTFRDWGDIGNLDTSQIELGIEMS